MDKKNVFKVASIYIGTLIGAGFASGQEIMCFFTRYGRSGIYGVMLTAILFSIIGSFILLKVYKHRVTCYNDWMIYFFGPCMGKIIECFLSLLLLSLYCVMLAGSGALFQEYFGYGKEIGIIFMSIIACITFIFSIKGLAFVNSMIVPLLIVGIITVGVFVIPDYQDSINQVDFHFDIIGDHWITSSLLYVSYNSISAAVVLSAMYPLLINKKVAISGGAIGGIGLGSMLLFLFLSTLIYYREIQDVEIPMMAIASKLGGEVGVLYGALLWFAMLTTAISNGFVFIQGMEKKLKINHCFACILFCIITVPLAQFGFKKLVHTLYPVFGYVGILIIFLIIGKSLKRK